jgi:hypothetical protein
MTDLQSIIKLTQETKHLPSSSFYLWLTEFFTNDALKEIKNRKTRECRVKIIEKIQSDLKYALNIFKEDKVNYEENQKQYFLKKKICIDQKIQQLFEEHIKILEKECKIV